MGCLSTNEDIRNYERLKPELTLLTKTMNVQRVCFNSPVVTCTNNDTKTRYIGYIDVVTEDGVCFKIEHFK